jgi:hypothetical protein
LKLCRAHKHLEDLNGHVQEWLGSGHHTVRYEFDLDARWNGPVPPGKHGVAPNTGVYYLAGAVFIPGQGPGTAPEGVEFGRGIVTALASASEQPPRDPISVLVGDALHNLRSALDTLAYALARAYTEPLTQEIIEASEFPIFGDESRKGTTGMGANLFRDNGRPKIQGWHPDAQTAVEGLQPYKRGADFRQDPLWALYELDRVSKHRLLHTAVAGHTGMLWDTQAFRNIRCIGPGLIHSFGGYVETDTPIGRIFGIHPIDPGAEMHVEIGPAMGIAFSQDTPVYAAEPVLESLGTIYQHIVDVVLPTVTPYL